MALPSQRLNNLIECGSQVDDGPGARVDWREAPATRPSWLERMQAAATAAARRHSQGEEVHGDSSATEALRGGSAVVGDGGSPPFAERSDNGIRRKPHPPPLEVSRFQRRLNSAMQQRRHETTTRADIPGSQLAAQQIQSGSLNPGSAEGHLEPAHPYNEDLRPSAFGESADASLCREMREASPLAPKSFGVSMRASVLPRDRDEDDLRLCWSSPAAASRTSGAGSMRSEHGSGSDYRSVQPVPQGHDELIEEQRSREYLEVLRVLEQGLAKAPFKHRDTLHAKQDKAMVRQSRPQVLQLTSPAPHHASRCPQVPESKARRVVAPKVRRGQTAPQQANPGHVHASGSLQNTAGVANSLGDVCALDSRWDNAPAGNANGTMDTMSNTDRAGRATADRIPALLGAWSKSAGSTETLVGTTDELRRSNRETRIGSGQPSGPSQGVATELPLHVPSPDGPSPGRMAFDTSRSETTIRDSWDTFQVRHSSLVPEQGSGTDM